MNELYKKKKTDSDRANTIRNILSALENVTVQASDTLDHVLSVHVKGWIELYEYKLKKAREKK